MIRWQPERVPVRYYWRFAIVGSALLWLLFGWLVILVLCEFGKALGYVT